jgi:hypothetical protein
MIEKSRLENVRRFFKSPEEIGKLSLSELYAYKQLVLELLNPTKIGEGVAITEVWRSEVGVLYAGEQQELFKLACLPLVCSLLRNRSKERASETTLMVVTHLVTLSEKLPDIVNRFLRYPVVVEALSGAEQSLSVVKLLSNCTDSALISLFEDFKAAFYLLADTESLLLLESRNFPTRVEEHLFYEERKTTQWLFECVTVGDLFELSLQTKKTDLTEYEVFLPKIDDLTVLARIPIWSKIQLLMSTYSIKNIKDLRSVFKKWTVQHVSLKNEQDEQDIEIAILTADANHVLGRLVELPQEVSESEAGLTKLCQLVQLIQLYLKKGRDFTTLVFANQTNASLLVSLLSP